MLRITGGYLKGRRVKGPPGRGTRPTTSVVRKAVFDVLEVGGKSFLELFCGSCVVSIEALSRGASEAAVVDISIKAIRTCRENLRDLGLLDMVRIYRADAMGFVKSAGRSFDVVFMDPPYDRGLVSRVLLSMNPFLLTDEAKVVVEKSRREEIEVPDFLVEIFRREYGDSVVLIFEKR